MVRDESKSHCRHRRLLKATAALVAVTALFGCPEATESPVLPLQAEPLDVQCEADSQCSDDEICVEGLCSLEPPGGDLEYGIILRPGQGQAIPTQVVDVATRPVLDAETFAEEAGVVSGELMTTDSAPAPDGTLVASPLDSSLLPGFQSPVRSGQFEIHLPAGEYRLTYIVDDAQWPRIPLGTHQLAQDSNALDLTIPTFSELRTVTGELSYEVLDLLDLLSEPIEGAEVVAQSPGSGHRSQVATTDEEGEFELHLPPGDDVFDVLVSPGPDNPVVPTVAFDSEIDNGTGDISLSVGELDLLDLVTATVEVIAQPIDDRSPDYRDYRLDIERPLTLGLLRLTPSIGEDGLVNIDLLPGSYDIEITPPPGAPWGPVSESTNLLDSLTSITVELPARHRVQGTVVDDNSAPLANARVQIIAADVDGVAPPASYTDEDGAFEFWLDPGDYELFVRPPVSTALPLHRLEFSISAADSDLGLDVQLNRGFIATGMIRTPDGQALSHAAVEVFIDGEEPPLPVGFDVTDSNGTYRIALPLP